MTDDIVARLRDCTCVPHGDICREAADEIERLRNELAAHVNENEALGKQQGEFIETIVKLEKQRDEAQREWCYMESCVRNEHGIEPADEPSIAAERGWNCYAKEGGGA